MEETEQSRLLLPTDQLASLGFLFNERPCLQNGRGLQRAQLIIVLNMQMLRCEFEFPESKRKLDAIEQVVSFSVLIVV